jgi:hypothetical protein
MLNERHEERHLAWRRYGIIAMLWVYAMPSMEWWMFISSILLLGLIAIAVWSFVHLATQSHAHASVTAPLAPPASDGVRQYDAHVEMDARSEPRCVHVTLLTVPQCAYSEEGKATLLRLAHEYRLAIDVVALRTPAGDRLAMQGGVLFPPGLFLDDEPFSYGRVSERTLRQELARRSGVRTGECDEATDQRHALASSRNQQTMLL